MVLHTLVEVLILALLVGNFIAGLLVWRTLVAVLAELRKRSK